MREKPQTIAFWRGRLPHWEVADGRYFVTIHLAGAIPEAGQRRIRELTARLNEAVDNGQEGLRLRRQIFRAMEQWLDRASPVSHLAVPEVAQMMTEAIAHRQENGAWKVYEHVIMPSHIHLFLQVLQGRLRDTLVAFKTWTGTQAARLIKRDTRQFWQDEWFDHWSRSVEEDEKIQRYIRGNPVRPGLAKSPDD